MRLKNILIVVEDVERSVKFYKKLFGMTALLDQGGNVMLTGGLVLQDRKLWEESLGKPILSENHASELYFEEKDIEAFVRKLEASEISVRYVTRLTTQPWGKQIVRFYDPDGNLIEVGTP